MPAKLNINIEDQMVVVDDVAIKVDMTDLREQIGNIATLHYDEWNHPGEVVLTFNRPTNQRLPSLPGWAEECITRHAQLVKVKAEAKEKRVREQEVLMTKQHELDELNARAQRKLSNLGSPKDPEGEKTKRATPEKRKGGVVKNLPKPEPKHPDPKGTDL